MACAVDGVSEDIAIDDMIALESEDATSEVEETKLKIAKTNPLQVLIGAEPLFAKTPYLYSYTASATSDASDMKPIRKYHHITRSAYQFHALEMLDIQF